MSTAYDILNFQQDAIGRLGHSARYVISPSLEQNLNKHIQSLNSISNKMAVDIAISERPDVVEKIIKKVWRYASEGVSGQFSIREMRVITYYLWRFHNNEKAFYYALDAIKNTWRDSLFYGLTYYLLNNWNELNPKDRVSVSKLLCAKLDKYKGDNKKYLAFKNNANFFQENGPKRMASLLVNKTINLVDAPKIIGYTSAIFSLSYFSDVVVEYFNGRDAANLEYVETVLKQHKLDRTRKLLFATLVEKADRSWDELGQTMLCDVAKANLGDISLSATWAPFKGASEAEIAKLKHARDLINAWYTRKAIDAFFSHIQDEERKAFWHRYASTHICDFRIVGSSYIRSRFEWDSKLSGWFSKYFIQTTANSYSETMALILCMKDKIVVEFSDVGAVYVYEHIDDRFRGIQNGATSINDIADLKQPQMGKLVDDYGWGYYYSNVGRIVHIGYWQNRLHAWIKEKIDKSSAPNMRFTRSGDDESVFDIAPRKVEPAPQVATQISPEVQKEAVKTQEESPEPKKEAVESQKETPQSSQPLQLTKKRPGFWSRIFGRTT